MYKRDNLNTIFENYIVFRELNPLREELPSFSELKKQLKLDFLPRKKDPEYAKVLSFLFKKIGDFEKVIYFGDTYLNDGSVIKNLTELNEYKVFGVITEEGEQDYIKFKGNMILNTKWRNLLPILEILEKRDFLLDEKTIVVIDIDKTFIGARGRNNKAIDKARTDAITSIIKDALGEIEEDRFDYIYSRLNRRSLHSFTGDNQDIVAIMSILFYGDYYALGRFIREFYAGNWREPLEFFNTITIPPNDKAYKLLEEVKENLLKKNPTAFPTFREKEFNCTLKRMDFLPDVSDVRKLLNEEILITKEVYDVGLIAKNKGALVFGLSDKPELSSIPKGRKKSTAIYLKQAKIFPK
ncbi:MAG TPA: hypothetical protein ENG37_00300 [Firmicutes bacterium]|nr:hypothetical protein [Bacillota bacterium]